MNNSTAVSDVTLENLPVIKHAGRPVVTTALLARVYGAEATQLINNYQRNLERFVAGKHFVKLEGEELKLVKDSISKRDADGEEPLIKPKAKSVILWTERGAARHAKMLDTDQAWEVFEKLEDSYFGVEVDQPAIAGPASAFLTPAEQRHVQQRVAELAGHDREKFASIYRSIKDHFMVGSYKDVPSSKYPEVCTMLMCKPLDGVVATAELEIPQIPLVQQRWLLAFDHNGNQRVTPVPAGAFVLSHKEFLNGLMTDGDIMVSGEEMFDYVIAGLRNLRYRYSAAKAKAKKAG